MLKYYYCLVPWEDTKGGTAEGMGYAYANQDRWIETTEDKVSEWQSGAVLGCAFVVKDQIAYAVRKSYMDLDNNWVVVICIESKQGCDTKIFQKSNTPLPVPPGSTGTVTGPTIEEEEEEDF